MQKIYVLDTNVLLCDPASILSFADRDVVIPMTVIEELDKLASLVESAMTEVAVVNYPRKSA